MTPAHATVRIVVAALAVGLGIPGVGAARQMPNPSEMSGVPLTVGDVPTGTVTVRVIRGTFANPVSSQTVEVVGGPGQMRAVTNDVGRAEFTGLTPGSRVKAVATVGGERLESREFDVPAKGGVRLILVAADPSGTTSSAQPSTESSGSATASPAQAGSVVLGDESRFVFEMGEDGLSVFYILQFVNRGSTPVQPEAPLVFTLPEDAKGATVLEGSSKQAAVAGRQLTVSGPFAPGATLVQLAYTMLIAGPDLVIDQRLPAALSHVAVVAQKVGDMQLASAQISEQRTMPAQGNLYIAGRGGPVQAGDMLRFTFSGMPHHPTWPRNVAIALACVILTAGAWAAAGSRAGDNSREAELRRLQASRDRLFDELTALETRHRQQQVDPDRYAARRRELVTAIERIYAALDDEAALGRAS